jgi:hypothetical protein
MLKLRNLLILTFSFHAHAVILNRACEKAAISLRDRVLHDQDQRALDFRRQLLSKLPSADREALLAAIAKSEDANRQWDDVMEKSSHFDFNRPDYLEADRELRSRRRELEDLLEQTESNTAELWRKAFASPTFSRASRLLADKLRGEGYDVSVWTNGDFEFRYLFSKDDSKRLYQTRVLRLLGSGRRDGTMGVNADPVSTSSMEDDALYFTPFVGECESDSRVQDLKAKRPAATLDYVRSTFPPSALAASDSTAAPAPFTAR